MVDLLLKLVDDVLHHLVELFDSLLEVELCENHVYWVILFEGSLLDID